MGWLAIGAIAARTVLAVANIVEKTPTNLKGSDKADLALNLLQDVTGVSGCSGAGTQIPQTPAAQEAYRAYLTAYVTLQNVIAQEAKNASSPA